MMDNKLEDAIERAKNHCVQKSGDGDDTFMVEIEKNGFKAYVTGTVFFKYYSRSQTYYEPAEETITIKSVDWDVDSFDEDLCDSEDGYTKEQEDEMARQITDEEVINAVCEEYGYEY